MRLQRGKLQEIQGFCCNSIKFSGNNKRWQAWLSSREPATRSVSLWSGDAGTADAPVGGQPSSHLLPSQGTAVPVP